MPQQLADGIGICRHMGRAGQRQDLVRSAGGKQSCRRRPRAAPSGRSADPSPRLGQAPVAELRPARADRGRRAAPTAARVQREHDRLAGRVGRVGHDPGCELGLWRITRTKVPRRRRIGEKPFATSPAVSFIICQVQPPEARDRIFSAATTQEQHPPAIAGDRHRARDAERESPSAGQLPGGSRLSPRLHSATRPPPHDRLTGRDTSTTGVRGQARRGAGVSAWPTASASSPIS